MMRASTTTWFSGLNPTPQIGDTWHGAENQRSHYASDSKPLMSEAEASYTSEPATFDSLAARALLLYVQKKCPPDERLTFALREGFGYALNQVSDPSQAASFLAPTASISPKFVASIAAIRTLAKQLLSSPELRSSLQDDSDVASALSAALGHMLLGTASLSEATSGPFEWISQGLLFGLILRRDYPELAEQLLTSANAEREHLAYVSPTAGQPPPLERSARPVVSESAKEVARLRHTIEIDRFAKQLESIQSRTGKVDDLITEAEKLVHRLGDRAQQSGIVGTEQDEIYQAGIPAMESIVRKACDSRDYSGAIYALERTIATTIKLTKPSPEIVQNQEAEYIRIQALLDPVPSRQPPQKTSTSACFIATAAYGSPLEPEVVVLRNFRDDVLNRYSAGRRFIEFYKLVSPKVATHIAANKTLRTGVRFLLKPLVFFCKYARGTLTGE